MKTYIVKYFFYENINSIFVTTDKEYAEKYVSKFNRILNIAKNHANDMKHKQYAGILNLSKKDYYRYNEILATDGCFYSEIETRP